jgi:hypothetical protein
MYMSAIITHGGRQSLSLITGQILPGTGLSVTFYENMLPFLLRSLDGTVSFSGDSADYKSVRNVMYLPIFAEYAWFKAAYSTTMHNRPLRLRTVSLCVFGNNAQLYSPQSETSS